MNSPKSVDAAGYTGKLVSTIAGVGVAAVATTTVIHHYEESRAHDVEKPLATIIACNEHGLIRATISDCIGSSDAADIRALLPAVSGEEQPALPRGRAGQPRQQRGRQGQQPPLHRETSVNQTLLAPATTRGLVLANATTTARNTAENRILTPQPFVVANIGEAERP